MPNQTVRRLATLYREGLDVYPSGMRGLARAPQAVVLKARPVKPAAASKFLEWIRATHPRLYAAAERRAAGRNLGQIETTKATSSTVATSGPLDRILTTVQELAPTYLQYRAQKEIFDAQMDRLRAGLPPIADPGAYAPTMRIGVDPAAIDAAAERARPFLIAAGIGLVGLFLLSRGRL